jgi:CRISPR-associated endonuclease Csn1
MFSQRNNPYCDLLSVRNKCKKLFEVKNTMNKKILGLDLGTNSIGWALVEKGDKVGQITGAGSRIIPMSQDILGKFDSGVSISQTAERTNFRGIRRLKERHQLRRERLHRVLNQIGFLPAHYSAQIDFERKLGQFLPETEPKLAYKTESGKNKSTFLFIESFKEMVADFEIHQPLLLKNKNNENALLPYDWTIYYLRKKALTQKIEKEELAWLILHFNQKRGYYQLRGEEQEEVANKKIEFHSLKVVDVKDSGDRKGKDEVWYNVVLENGWIYRRTSKSPLDWIGKHKEFIVTTDLNEDGTIKLNKDGEEKRSFRAPAEGDWTLVKKKTEFTIEKTNKTVGEYIYDEILNNPDQKIKGKLVRTIERKFYKAEIETILSVQQNFHPELQSKELLHACINELYEHNESHQTNLKQKDFVNLFLNDILFYQRPLKSKKSQISDCKFEKRPLKDKNGRLQKDENGKTVLKSLKCIAKSHPLFQEFRLLNFIQNLRIYEIEKQINGKLMTDVDVTNEFLKTSEDWEELYNWLNEKDTIDQKGFLAYPIFKLKRNENRFRWNYVADKEYPCNQTRAMIVKHLNKIEGIPTDFLNETTFENLWHILYSVEDKLEIEKALATFASKHKLPITFVEVFKKTPPFKKEYGAYSAKAIKKMLPLMRRGMSWSKDGIDINTLNRIQRIIDGEYDEKIRDRVREKSINLREIEHFQGLPEWLVSYLVYDRHSEDSNTMKWKTPSEITLLEQHSLRNPIVEQIINETLQVVRDIWSKYGKGAENYFDEIHIELGREMKNPKSDREKMTKQITENENTNLRIKALLIELMEDKSFENVRPYSPSQQEILKIYEEGALNSSDIDEEILKISKTAQPSKSELIKYKLWLSQKYRSPYTGAIIPLNKLFTPAYEIEHIIPQSRFFDDSFSNKVICEAAVNKLKDNCTAMEFIINERGRTVETGMGISVKIFTKEEYEDFVKNNYAQNRGKLRKLLMEDIPESFIQRQLNDTRYISKFVKNLLSNIVREENEQETVSKNIISCNGTITSNLKQDWGLNDVWNELITPRFERLNEMTSSQNFGSWTNKDGKRVFQTQVPLELQKGFSKKRIDHRHHAMDAIVIACTTRDHVNYLNNESALGKKSKAEKENKRYDLKNKLCFKKFNSEDKQNYKWAFTKPWESFTVDSKQALNGIIVSFKQNNRIINKTVNLIQKWTKDANGKMTKQLVKQEEGATKNWAIRKPLHKDTVAGLVKLKFKKMVSLSLAIDNWEMIVNKDLRKEIKKLVNQNFDKKMLLQFFKEQENKWQGVDVSKIEIYYWDVDNSGQASNVASRVKVDESFNSIKINSVTDSGIQTILKNHLKKYDEVKGDKIVEHPELAFSPDGIDEMNVNLTELNDGKQHKSIYKVRTFEPKGNKFNVGNSGNKKDKFVEAAKGTNLFFAIYQDENGKRNYETIPLNIVIERQIQGLSSVPETNEKGDRLLFHLSPNDLVYIPNSIENNELNYDKIPLNDIYKIVSFTGNRLYSVPFYYANSIVDKFEFTQLNKLETTINKKSIKEFCLKLKNSRIGEIANI